LIEKIKDKDLSIFEQLKNNYPHLIVYFYDKYRDDDEYKDYMEDMSDYFEWWMNTFTVDLYLLDFIVCKEYFRINWDNIGLLKRYEKE